MMPTGGKGRRDFPLRLCRGPAIDAFLIGGKMTPASHASPSLTRSPGTKDSNLELIGSVVRLQVQLESLKHGQRPRSWYDPSPIRSLNALRITADGVTGIDDVSGDAISDVHHRDHTKSKFRGENGVSLGFTSHYLRMRARFGGHLSDGVAGENILVQSDRVFTEEDLHDGVVIITRQGPVSLGSAEIAKPCVEYSKFCVGYEPDQLADSTITETLQFLFDGTRGFYVSYDQDVPRQFVVSVGDIVYRCRSAAT
jgi:hypothetical protein